MMKEKMNAIEIIGKFIGASAWGFTHMPMLIAQELKKNRKKKEKEKAMKNLPLLEKYCDELIAEGRMTEEQKDALVWTVLFEYWK